MSNSAISWAVACQAPLSLGFSRQEDWSGSHSLLQGIFLTQGLLHCRQILYHPGIREAGEAQSGACLLSRFSCVQLCVTP